MIGEKIVAVRKKKGWSQKDLAERLKMDPANLAKIENGRSTPSSKTLSKIAEKLGSPVEYFTAPDVTEEFDEIEFNKLVKKIPTLPLKRKKALAVILHGLFDITRVEKSVTEFKN